MILLSCSEDEELDKLSEPLSEEAITGTWKATDLYLLNGKLETSVLSLNLDLEGKEYNTEVTFDQNPNTISTNGDITVTATVSAIGLSVSEDFQEDLGMNGQWTLANNVLTISNNGISQEYEIVEFSGTTITFKQAIDEDFDKVSGYSGRAKGTLYIEFVKQ